jgi:hypothetical protein
MWVEPSGVIFILRFVEIGRFTGRRGDGTQGYNDTRK